MKKFSIAMLSMVLAGSMLLTGCGGSKTADSSSDAQDSTTSTSADGGTLRMGTNATFPPYEFVGDDGNVQGIDADIAAAIADKLGMKLEITDMEFDSLIPALQSDTIDVALAGMTVTPDRQENVDFSDSYAKGVQVIIVKDGSDIASPDDLEGKNISFCGRSQGGQVVSHGPDRLSCEYRTGTMGIPGSSRSRALSGVRGRPPAIARQAVPYVWHRKRGQSLFLYLC